MFFYNNNNNNNKNFFLIIRSNVILNYIKIDIFKHYYQEQVILNLTQQDYIAKIRKVIAYKNCKTEIESGNRLGKKNFFLIKLLLFIFYILFIMIINIITFYHCIFNINIIVEMTNEEKEAYEKLATKRRNYMKKITSQDTKT